MPAISDQDILGSRLLIIDDEAANIGLLETLLADEGFEQVLSTTDPSRCEALVSAFQPDLILLDLWMPEVDGFEVLARLDQHQQGYLPVIVLTADASRRTRHRALALGARDLLTKPLDPLDVMLRIWNQLETVQLFRRLQRHVDGLDSPGAGLRSRL